MTRIAIIDRADMNGDQARVFDAAVASGGVTGGPYFAYIRIPKIFESCQSVRHALFSGPLSGRERQIANLVAARHWNSDYPWVAQVRGALAAGLEQSVIDAINARKTPDLPNPRERACFAVSSELLATQRVSDKTYAEAEKALGLTDLIALVATTGSFSMTCMTSNTFEVDAPANAPTPLAR